MPRNRADVARDDKVDAIIDAASRQIRAGGYDGLSVQAIARELGVARTAVAWYFPSKDGLFVAVTARSLADAFAHPPATKSVERRIEWAVDTLYSVRPHYLALQERARHHRGAAELLDAFQREMCDRLHDLLAGRVPTSEVVLSSDTIVIFIEGLLVRDLDDRGRHRYLRHLIRNLVPSPST